MNKHDAADLAQMQSLSLESKILMTKQRVRDWYNHFDGDVYVSWSGGKDSTVLKHIVDSMYDDVPAVYVNTGLEYPEITHFVKRAKNGEFDCFNSYVEILRPEMRFDEVIKKHGYPVLSKETAHCILYGRIAEERGDILQVEKYVDGLKINRKTGEKYYFKPLSQTAKKLFKEKSIPVSDACCLVMKKTPAKKFAKETGRKPIIGTMASESKLRLRNWIQNGCNAFNLKEPTSQPLSFWTKQDILHYIKNFNVPYAPVYGDIVEDDSDMIDGQVTLAEMFDNYDGVKLKTTGCDRTGCMFCMFGVHLDKEPNRFQRMKITHPKQYEYCMKDVEEGGLGIKKVLEFINVKYE